METNVARRQLYGEIGPAGEQWVHSFTDDRGAGQVQVPDSFGTDRPGFPEAAPRPNASRRLLP